MPGGGAEIFHPEVREQICDNEVRHRRSGSRSTATAHGMGLTTQRHDALRPHRGATSTASTTCCGCASCRTRRAASRPSSRWPSTPRTPASTTCPGPTGRLDLRVMAVSRLLLDNVPHLKAYWIMLGPKTAQVALSFGADDLDGTVVEERIVHMAGRDQPGGDDGRATCAT